MLEYSIWIVIGITVGTCLFILSIAVMHRKRIDLPKNLILFNRNSLCSVNRNSLYSGVLYLPDKTQNAEYIADGSSLFKSIIKENDECIGKLQTFEEQRDSLRKQYYNDRDKSLNALKKIALVLVPGLILGGIALGNIMIKYISIVKGNYLLSSISSMISVSCVYSSILVCFYKIKINTLDKFYHEKDVSLNRDIEMSYARTRIILNDIVVEHGINSIVGVPDGFRIVNQYPEDDKGTYKRYITGNTGRCYHEKKDVVVQYLS